MIECSLSADRDDLARLELPPDSTEQATNVAMGRELDEYIMLLRKSRV